MPSFNLKDRLRKEGYYFREFGYEKYVGPYPSFEEMQKQDFYGGVAFYRVTSKGIECYNHVKGEWYEDPEAI